MTVSHLNCRTYRINQKGITQDNTEGPGRETSGVERRELMVQGAEPQTA